jgi:hypothetical protein
MVIIIIIVSIIIIITSIIIITIIIIDFLSLKFMFFEILDWISFLTYHNLFEIEGFIVVVMLPVLFLNIQVK